MSKNENTKSSFETLFKKSLSSVSSCDVQPEAEEAMNAIHQLEARLNQAKDLLEHGNLSLTYQQKLAKNIAIKTEELDLAKVRFEHRKYVLTL